MLLSTQILNGIGATVYLCIGPGGIYCFNAEPDACSYCPAETSPQEQGEDDEPCRCCGRKHHQEPRQLFGGSCGCKHIQISGGQSSSAVRPANLIDAEQLLGLLAWLPLLPPSEIVRPIAHQAPERSLRLTCAPGALAALSTVVIRC